jgi:FMN phosphatase YigB (HAD superfamily)
MGTRPGKRRVPVARPVSPPRLSASTIFFDIDDTITQTVADGHGETVLGTLVSLVARVNRLEAAAAEARIRATLDFETETIDSHCDALGITLRQLWDGLAEWLPRQVVGFPDAVAAIQTLHARGFRLFTCTTNSSFIARVKLSGLGLTTFEGSPYFSGMLGGAEVHPQGKTAPEFYSNLMKLAQVEPGDVVHVGDSPQTDLLLARQAGISQVVLPRRTQAPDWVREADGGIYVRSLSLLPRMVN